MITTKANGFNQKPTTGEKSDETELSTKGRSFGKKLNHCQRKVLIKQEFCDTTESSKYKPEHGCSKSEGYSKRNLAVVATVVRDLKVAATPKMIRKKMPSGVVTSHSWPNVFLPVLQEFEISRISVISTLALQQK